MTITSTGQCMCSFLLGSIYTEPTKLFFNPVLDPVPGSEISVQGSIISIITVYLIIPWPDSTKAKATYFIKLWSYVWHGGLVYFAMCEVFDVRSSSSSYFVLNRALNLSSFIHNCFPLELKSMSVERRIFYTLNLKRIRASSSPAISSVPPLHAHVLFDVMLHCHRIQRTFSTSQRTFSRFFQFLFFKINTNLLSSSFWGLKNGDYIQKYVKYCLKLFKL